MCAFVFQFCVLRVTQDSYLSQATFPALLFKFLFAKLLSAQLQCLPYLTKTIPCQINKRIVSLLPSGFKVSKRQPRRLCQIKAHNRSAIDNCYILHMKRNSHCILWLLSIRVNPKNAIQYVYTTIPVKQAYSDCMIISHISNTIIIII